MVLLGLPAAMVLTACAAGSGSDTDDVEADGFPGVTEDSGAGADSEPVEAEDLTLRLNWTPYAADHAFYYYGVASGIYESHGINLSVEPGNGSATVLKLVDNGSSPVALIDAATMLGGIEQGMDVAMVAAINQQSPMAFVFRADAPIEDADDLVGKRIVVTQGDALSQVLPAVLNRAGLSADDIETISSPTPAAKETAVLQGDADALLAFYTEQPLRMEAVTGVDMDWTPFSEFGINTFNMGVVMNTSWREENPELAERFVQATQEAIEATVDNPEAAAEAFIAEVPGFDLELAVRQVEATVPLLHTEASEGQPIGWMAPEDWEATVEVMTEYAGLSLEDVDEVYTNELVEAGE